MIVKKQALKTFILSLGILTGFMMTVPQAGLAEALTKDESEDFNIDDYLVENDAVSEDELLLFYDDTDVELDYSEVDLENLEYPISGSPVDGQVTVFVAPLVIAVVVRLVGQWVGKQAVRTITKHAAQRATERGISSAAFARAMAYGTKYTDKNTGARILYHSGDKVALVMDNAGKTVVTTYIQKSPKAVWKKGW